MPPAILLDTLVGKFLDHAETHLRPATVRSYSDALRRFSAYVGPKRTTDISTEDVNGFIATERARGRAPGGINVRLRAIKACLRWGAQPDVGYLRDVPRVRLLRVPRVRRGRALNSADVARLIELAKPREKALIALIASTGLRIDEALHLQWADVDVHSMAVEVSAKPEVGWVQKSHQLRTVFLSDRAAEYLRAYRATQSEFWRGPNDWVFQGRRPGRRLTTATKPARELFAAAGLYEPGKLWHELRRGCATAMLRSGVDIVSVQHVLGHESVTTTQLYIRTGEEELQAAARHALL